ncbi:MAG TPA: sensor histidine kinase [Methylibium sp.]|uniref:sensor histidine kinase n=1 Tax=Methylibium sp. TaxID=2067992 RepID=UPI002DB9163C|nr:sensor histidine kinase [Methylibium sp.]HEU4457974.1 sensor histidine kinase [Methylibium sp.]
MLRSLKATLMVWVVALIVLLVPLRLYFELRVQLSRTDAAYDVGLSDWALALGNLVRLDQGEVSFNLNEQTEASLRTTSTDDKTYYAVLDPAGRRVAGDPPLAELPLALRRGERRLLDGSIDGRPVRVAAHAVLCGMRLCQVRVAETLGKREAARREALHFALWFALVFGLVLAVAIWLAVSRAMRPVASINEQLAQRSLDDLRPLEPAVTGPVAPPQGRLPSEIAPLVHAIDQLLQRVAGDAARQRHFIADAAHQLRTPLAALHAEAELALLESHPPAVHATLQRMHRSTRRLTRLADQLLSLARSEAAVRAAVPGESVDLKRVAQDAAQDWVPRALERGADLGFQLEPATVRGSRHLIGELLANLLHNALEYAAIDPARPARITVRTAQAGPDGTPRPMLEVEDNGPGIAPAERRRVLERFYRAPGSPGAGSGLGLAIVADIARAHGAGVELLDGEDGGGLKVRVVFPRNSPGPATGA